MKKDLTESHYLRVEGESRWQHCFFSLNPKTQTEQDLNKIARAIEKRLDPN
jgi:hypothetical protein